MSSNNKPHVLFITRKFPPSVGGMEKHAFELQAALSQETSVSLVKWGGSAALLPIILPYFLLRSSWDLITKKIDIIQLQDGLLSPLGVILKTIFRKPLCVFVHGLDVTYKNKLYQAVIKWSLKKADTVICNSNATRAEVLKRGINPDTTIFIPLGINDDIFFNNRAKARQYLEQHLKMTKNSKIILSVGRLVERKGVHWFVANVMPELVKADNNVLLLISGDGDSRPLIEAAINDNQLQAHVQLLGRTSDEIRQNLYNGADLFVMPNIVVKNDVEGFGLVLLEASLCELPIVAAGIEGIKDAITDGQNGILVETEDAQAYIKAATKFLNDPVAVKKFGQASRRFTKAKYDWSLIADKYIEAYQSIKQGKAN